MKGIGENMADEPVYIDMDDEGNLYGNRRKSKKKKQNRKGENEFDWKFLNAFHRGQFSSTRDKSRWHKITKKAMDQNDPEAPLYAQWIEGIIKWGSDKNMWAVMTACENNERWLDFLERNKEKIVDKKKEKQVESELDALETVVSDER